MSILKNIKDILILHHNRLFFLSIIAISVIALAYAFFVEYALGFESCHLCLYQRIPYFLLIISGIAGVIIKNNRYILVIFAVMFTAAIVLAGYHTGVENGIFTASEHCNAEIVIPEGISAEEFRDMLYASPIASCTRAAYKIFGISMTEWNLVLNIFLLISSFIAIRYKK